MYSSVVRLSIVVLLFLLSRPAVGGNITYVDSNAAGPTHDGASWCAAYLSLSEALDVAGVGDTIRVADGQYTPDAMGLADSRDAAFAIPSGIALEGGYAGCGASDPDQRDLQLFETILSGDLIGDDQPDFGNRSDNVYHVVTTHDVSNTTILDGLTITAGHANGPNFGASVDSRDQGGGVNNYHGHPLLVNVTIVDNHTNNHGAFNDHGGATFVGCLFIGNQAGNIAGGLYIHHIDVGPTSVTDCTFTNNEATNHGGGAYNKGSTAVTMTGCSFSGNAAFRGGALYNNVFASTTLQDCAFDNNTVVGILCRGGAIYNDVGTEVAITNCSFSGNSAEDPKAHAKGGAMYSEGSDQLTLTDCSFVGNGAFEGAGMYSLSCDPVLLRCSFDGHFATGFLTPYNGAFYSAVGEPTLTDCTFSEPQGVGAFLGLAVRATLRNCTFVDNVDNAIYLVLTDVNSPPTLIENCNFIDNVGQRVIFAFANPGPGFPRIDVRNCVFRGNARTITAWHVDITVSNTSFVGNQGWGGVRVGGPSLARFENCLFTGNQNANGGFDSGGAIRVGGSNDGLEFSQLALVNCTFSRNQSLESGGGLYLENAHATIDNCIFRQNEDANGSLMFPSQIYTGVGGTYDLNYSSVAGYSLDLGGVGNLVDVDPLFVDDDGPDDIAGTEDDDLRLLPESPCIDAADNVVLPAETTTDLDDQPRFVDIANVDDTGSPADGTPVVDMGAYEFLADCNGNGIADEVDIANGTSLDCNANGVPESCELLIDCNDNATPDACEITDGTAQDCNANLIPDTCDIVQGTALDTNGNNQPDTCDLIPTATALGGRYLAVSPPDWLDVVALRLTAPSYPCLSKYVDADGSLVDLPVFRTSVEWGTVQVHGSDIIPGTEYVFEVDDGTTVSLPLPIVTSGWGDVDNSGVVNLADAQLVVLGFQGNFTLASLEAMDLLPCNPNGIANLEDVFGAVLAFQGNTYENGACTLPCP